MTDWMSDNAGPIMVLCGATVSVVALLAPVKTTPWQMDCKTGTIRQASSTDGKTQTMTVTCEVKQ